MLSHNRFFDYLVLIFVEKKKAQIYTFPNRVYEHDVIKLIIDFQYKRLFRPNKHLERYHITKPQDESFLFKIGDKKYLYVGESIFSFTTNSNITKYGLNYGYNDINSTFKDEYSYLYRNNKTNGKKLQKYKLIHK